MKNIKYISILSAVVFFGLFMTVFAQGVQNGNRAQDVQIQAQTEMQTQNQGEEQMLLIQTNAEYKAGNADDLKEAIQAKKAEMGQQGNAMSVAVHAFLASEELTDGIGPRVSEIAREFNNSVQASEKAEEKMATRSTFRKFFFGGDKEAAGELEQETIRNQNRVEEMTLLMNRCEECSAEVKNILEEQIQLVKQEQERLANLANNEKGKRGLFGYLFGWMFK